jgi:hypothetical protein
MHIDFGDLERLEFKATTIESHENKTTVENITMFMLFSNVAHQVYINLDRKAAKKIISDLNNIFDNYEIGANNGE